MLAIGEDVAMPAAAEYPRTIGIGLRPVPDSPLDLLGRRRIEQVDAIERGAAVDEVEMRVVESGQDGGAFRVDHPGQWPLQAGDLAIAADTQNLIAANRDGFGHRPLVVRGVDPSVVDDEIHRPIVVVPLRADNQAGDQRERNDGDNDECGETGRHFDLRKRRVERRSVAGPF